MPTDIQSLMRVYEHIFSTTERNNRSDAWNTVSRYVTPNNSNNFRAGTTTGSNYTPGEKKTGEVFDSTAIIANRDLAAAINFVVTNPSSEWSKFKFKSKRLMEDRDSLKWLDEAMAEIQGAINDSDFDVQAPTNYEAYTSLGNMILFQEDMGLDDDSQWRGFHFKAWALAETAFSENSDGVVDVFYKKFQMTLRQAIEKWPDTISDEIKRRADMHPEELEVFVLAIYPRNKEDVRYDSLGLARPEERPYAGVYFYPKDKTVLEETGYYELPVYATRWGTMPGEVYGRGPGELALPDIRTLNKMTEEGLKSMALSNRPPIFVRDMSVLADFNMFPGAVNVMRGNPSQDLYQFVPQVQWDVARMGIQDQIEKIRQAFYIDKLMLPPRTETGEMSAFEVSERLNQMNRVIGPVLGRLNREFLKPLLLRSFNIMLRRGQLPEMPPLLREEYEREGFEVDVVFINQMARSQQMEDITNMRTLTQLVGEKAAIRPEVVDNLDVDAMTKKEAEILGVGTFALNDPKRVEAIRKAREKQVQAQRLQEAAVTAADVASKTGGGNQGGE